MISKEKLQKFSGAKVLVTGGSGMIGREVVKLMCDAGAQVTVASLDRVLVDERAEHRFADLRDFALCKQLCSNQNFVFHLAGVKGSMEVSTTMLASHFVPTLMMNTNVLEACRVESVGKVVVTSSIGAYEPSDFFVEKPLGSYDGPPLDFAGWAKRMGELQIYAYQSQFGLENFSIVRPSAVYGPGDNFDPKSAMVVPSLMAKIRSGQKIDVWGDGKAVRDIAFSRDIAEGIIMAVLTGTKGYVNLGSGYGVSIKDLVETLRSFIDFDYEFDTSKPAGKGQKLLDISKARKLLGYEPATPLRKGLEETWQWFLANEDEHILKQNYFRDDTKK
jgi:GDP-L-fucose synthase